MSWEDHLKRQDVDSLEEWGEMQNTLHPDFWVVLNTLVYFFNLILFSIMYRCVPPCWICVLSCRCPQRPKGLVRSPGIRVADGCESPDVDARNQIQVLSTAFSYWAIYFASPLSLSFFWFFPPSKIKVKLQCGRKEGLLLLTQTGFVFVVLISFETVWCHIYYFAEGWMTLNNAIFSMILL